jgi:hypothetical protein
MLDDAHRERVIAARDSYEAVFRGVIRDGITDGSFRPDTDPKLSAIFVLSALNAIERWYRSDGEAGPEALVAALDSFLLSALSR